MARRNRLVSLYFVSAFSADRPSNRKSAWSLIILIPIQFSSQYIATRRQAFERRVGAAIPPHAVDDFVALGLASNHGGDDTSIIL